MMSLYARIVVSSLCVGALCSVANAGVFPVAFTKLTGDTGGSPAATAVYRADLSGLPLAEIQSLRILDNSGGLGGATGKFTGFDLDAVKLANTSVDTAADAAVLAGLPLFDFGAGTLFTPGTQRPPADPDLFGAVGSTVDNSVASLGLFDGNSTTGPTAFGFLSMGDNGSIIFNLTAPAATPNLYLYIGEVGDNGEVAAGSVTVSDTVVPEPGTLALLGAGLLPLLRRRRR